MISGCIVQSVNPFYTKRSVCDMPDIEGEWSVVDDSGEPRPVKLWVFQKGKIITYDEKGSTAEIKAVYFKVGKTFFLDSTIEGPAAGTSSWWTTHVFPVHVVTKVRIEGDRLTLTPIDYDWLDKAVKKGAVKLPHVRLTDENAVIFTALPQEWMKFLGKYSGNRNVFPDKNEVRLVRSKGDRKNP